MEPLQTATHEINFDSVDFSYVPGEPVLKHATFTVPDQKLTAIVGDSGSGKSTILNLIAKYYEANGGTISIGGKAINHVAAERVLEQISMVDQDVFLFQQIGDGLLYCQFVLDVKGRCCLIQKQDRAVFQNSAGD